MAEEDRLSGLPDDIIINYILSFLPMNSTIRTGILSKRWLHLWKFVNLIHFPPLPDSETQMDYGFVDQCLGLLRAPRIDKLIIVTHFCRSSERNFRSWVDFAITRHVRRFEIYMIVNSYSSLERDYYAYAVKDYFKLSVSFFLHKNTELTEHMALSQVHFIPPPPPHPDVPGLVSGGNVSLITLLLYECSVSDEGLQSIISTCGVLERLRLIRCTGLWKPNISSMSLKEFVFIRNDEDCSMGFQIDAPNLVTLKGYGLAGWITSFNKSCHPLEVRLYDNYDNYIHKVEEDYDELLEYYDELFDGGMKHLIDQLSCVKHFGINTTHFAFIAKALHINGGPQTTFKNIEEIYFASDKYSKDEVIVLLTFLGECPSLNKLQIEFEDLAYYGCHRPLKMLPYTRGFFKVPYLSPSHYDGTYFTELTDGEEKLLLKAGSLHQLKTIEFFSYRGIKDHLEMAKRLLQKAGSLERVVLFFDDYDDPEHHDLKQWRETVPLHVKEQLQKQVSNLPRASPHAQVILG